MSTQNVELKKDLPIIELKVNPKLILSDNLMQELSLLEKKVEKGIEWSGILIYSTKQGSFENLIEEGNWEILAERVVLMDIGTSGYTEYDFSSNDEYSFNIISDSLEEGKKLGHIHTHHSMKAFFSGTDTNELIDNAPKHNYYVSLIVNYSSYKEWCCKVAFVGEIEEEGNLQRTISFKGLSGLINKITPIEKKSKRKVLFTANFIIDLETPEVDQFTNFKNRINEVLDLKKKKREDKFYYPGGYESFKDSYSKNYNYKNLEPDFRRIGTQRNLFEDVEEKSFENATINYKNRFFSKAITEDLLKEILQKLINIVYYEKDTSSIPFNSFLKILSDDIVTKDLKLTKKKEKEILKYIKDLIRSISLRENTQKIPLELYSILLCRFTGYIYSLEPFIKDSNLNLFLSEDFLEIILEIYFKEFPDLIEVEINETEYFNATNTFLDEDEFYYYLKISPENGY